MFINAFFNIARKIAYDVGNLHFPYLDVPFNPATERHEGEQKSTSAGMAGLPCATLFLPTLFSKSAKSADGSHLMKTVKVLGTGPWVRGNFDVRMNLPEF